MEYWLNKRRSIQTKLYSDLISVLHWYLLLLIGFQNIFVSDKSDTQISCSDRSLLYTYTTVCVCVFCHLHVSLEEDSKQISVTVYISQVTGDWKNKKLAFKKYADLVSTAALGS